MRPLSQNEIKRMYSEGHRDFTNILCREADFSSLDMSGADFSGSNLEGSRFRYSNLNDSKFVKANLNWCNFDYAKMKNADFTNANLSYSKMTSPKFDKTIFRGADFSWALLFKANEEDADFTDAITGNIARTFSEMSDFGVVATEEELKRSGLSSNFMSRIKRGVDTAKEKWLDKIVGIFRPKPEVAEKLPEYGRQEVSRSAVRYGEAGGGVYNRSFSYGQRTINKKKKLIYG